MAELHARRQPLSPAAADMLSFRVARTLLLVGLTATMAVAQTATGGAQEPTSSAMWRTSRNCGANCLYLLLRAEGRNIDYDRVLQATAIGPKGSSLVDLRQAAETLGSSARVGKGSVDDLKLARLPVMVHLDAATGDVSATGHFVLVTALSPDGQAVSLFDGASALQSEIPMNAFKRAWSGYVLELAPPDDRLLKVAVTIACLGGAWFLYVHRCRVWRLAEAT